MAIGYLDAPPALEWREHHEQIGRPVAPVFVIMSGGLSWFRRDRHARFGNELLGRLVDADQGTFRIMRPLINVQDVLHGGHEGGAGVRWNDPLLSQMRLESVFFSVRPIVLSLARLTIFSSTTASSSSCNVQRARPAGGLEQANAINLASAAPSEMLSLLIAQCHYVFLYRDLFSGHQSAPSAATEPSNQTNTAESMTGATSPD